MFTRFKSLHVTVSPGVDIHARVGGEGPPLLLLHGAPQSSFIWHDIADELAEHFSVVAADLRGYGDSTRVSIGARHDGVDPLEAFSKRVMAADMATLMSRLGFEHFDVCAHDRGARVAHRLALDHEHRVRRLMTLDIAPTLAMYEGTTDAFARAYWHWFFFIQPAPLPERLIEADPIAFMRRERQRPDEWAFSPAAQAEYERCISIPGSAACICNDYRASAGIDLEHDRADRESGRHLKLPHRVIWGAQGAIEKCFDPMALWRAVSHDVSGRAFDCGHFIAEERSDELLVEIRTFFGS